MDGSTQGIWRGGRALLPLMWQTSKFVLGPTGWLFWVWGEVGGGLSCLVFFLCVLGFLGFISIYFYLLFLFICLFYVLPGVLECL